MVKHQLNDIIIVIPGILGSVLQHNGKDVWAPKPGAIADAILTLTRNVKALAIKADPVDADELGDGVTATELVRDVHLIPGFTAIDGYTGIRGFLFEHFDLAEGHNYFEFAYDWRRDNRVAARKLKRYAEDALARARRTAPSARLILLAHSMGGLVAQYYLECMDGAKDARMLITLGTPFRGAVNALDFIAHGFRKTVAGIDWLDLSVLLRSMTSAYQLLPRYACVHVADEWRRPADSEGIPNLDYARARQALDDFHIPMERAIDNRASAGYRVFPIVGIGQPTWESARVVRDNELFMMRGRTRGDGEFTLENGDGTVPRPAAMPIGFDQDGPCHFTYAKHGGLQNSASVQAQVLGLLTGIPDLDDLRDARSGLALEMDPLFAAAEPIMARVTAEQPRLDLVATITDTASGQVVAADLQRVSDGLLHKLCMSPLPPGCYRLQVGGKGRSDALVSPLADLFMVMAARDAGA